MTDHRLKKNFFEGCPGWQDISVVSEFAAKHDDLSSISKTHMVERRNGKGGSPTRGKFPNSETGPVPRCSGCPVPHMGHFSYLLSNENANQCPSSLDFMVHVTALRPYQQTSASVLEAGNLKTKGLAHG